jgi:hypothetical protein
MAAAQRWLNRCGLTGMCDKSLPNELVWAAVGLVEDHATPSADRLAMVAALRTAHEHMAPVEEHQPRLFSEINAALRKETEDT